MLEAWMNQEEEPTWSKIVAALREMKKTALAEQIASKFGELILKKVSLLCTNYVLINCGTSSNRSQKGKKLFILKPQRYLLSICLKCVNGW